MLFYLDNRELASHKQGNSKMDTVRNFLNRPLNVGLVTVGALGGLHVAGVLTVTVGLVVGVVGVALLVRSLSR